METSLDNIKSVLIIRCGALGDLVYSTSVIDALKKQYGDHVQIDWVCKQGLDKLFVNDPRVRRVFQLKHRRIPVALSPSKRKIVSSSERDPYDLLINLESKGPIFDPLVKAINARYKIGAPFTTVSQSSLNTHMVDVIKKVYSPVISNRILETSFPKLFGTNWSTIQEKYSLPEKYIIINPSNSHNKRSGLNHRAWPITYWENLIKQVDSRVPLVIIAARGEESYFECLHPFPSNVIDLAGKTTITDLVGIINHAQCIITTDTGPAHIASAVSTTTYALVGPTPPNTWPYQTNGNTVNILSANLECSPCYGVQGDVTCKDNLCMKEIVPEQVVDAVKPIITSIV